MNVIQLVKSVLDEQYALIPGSSEKEKDNQIRERLAYLSRQYENLAGGDVEIDYSDPITRFAYIYRYVTAHADFVCQLLSSTGLGNKLFHSDDDEEAKTVSVTCVGGGPGSDLVGVLKFIERQRMEPVLRFMLLDREKLWSDAWYGVDAKLDNPLKTSVYFLQLDVTDEKSWAGLQRYKDSDLFTFIYFISELYGVRGEAAKFFANLFADAKSGARFLFIDNNDFRFYGGFDGLCGKAKLERVAGDEARMTTDTVEEKTDLGKYYEKFRDPKLQAKVAYRYLKKK